MVLAPYDSLLFGDAGVNLDSQCRHRFFNPILGCKFCLGPFR